MLDDYLPRILCAPVYDVARETPLDPMPEISRRLGVEVWLKREDLQPVFSYKLRGAYTLMSALDESARRRGVIAASAGNHAQGVALAARKLGLRAVIVMPRTTPEIKVEATRRLGGEVILHGSNYDAAAEHAHHIEVEEGLTWVPPFDHPLVIAGQGTVGMEILRQHRGPLDAVYVPVGGGGLVAGIGAYLKTLVPQVRIIGVEPEEAPSMVAALAAGAPVRLEQVGIFADGAAVRTVGTECFRVARACLDDCITVSNDEICAAIKDIHEDLRTVAEPAGALALAGLKQQQARGREPGQRLIAILSGANVNFDRLRHIAELAELGEQREALFGVRLPERPGAFRGFCEALGLRGITEFNYRYADPEEAYVFAGVRLRHGAAERRQIIEQLGAHGYPVTDLSGDELAKMHVRYMVGGHAAGAADEVVYRFEFPERPGALLHFLTRLGSHRNISLFHYRNHGAAYGRVLVGVQVPPAERAAFRALIDDLGMAYAEETANPAYRMFLGRA
jgi:threonine dehydratase